MACERHSPGLARIFLEAGMPWNNVRGGGDGARERLWASAQQRRRAASRSRRPAAPPALAPTARPCLSRSHLPQEKASHVGDPASLRAALRGRKHERLMRVIAVLSGERLHVRLASSTARLGCERAVCAGPLPPLPPLPPHPPPCRPVSARLQRQPWWSVWGWIHSART